MFLARQNATGLVLVRQTFASLPKSNIQLPSQAKKTSKGKRNFSKMYIYQVVTYKMSTFYCFSLHTFDRACIGKITT